MTAPIAKTASRLRSCYTSTETSWRRNCREIARCEIERRIYDKMWKLEL